jgi:hypothetical protein
MIKLVGFQVIVDIPMVEVSFIVYGQVILALKRQIIGRFKKKFI